MKKENDEYLESIRKARTLVRAFLHRIYLIRDFNMFLTY